MSEGNVRSSELKAKVKARQYPYEIIHRFLDLAVDPWINEHTHTTVHELKNGDIDDS